MYAVIYSKQASRTVQKCPRNVAALIRRKIDEIAADPFAQHNNITKLVGRPGFRLRVGDWRVIYELEDQQLVMLVIRIAPRGGVYE